MAPQREPVARAIDADGGGSYDSDFMWGDMGSLFLSHSDRAPATELAWFSGSC